MTVSLTGSGGLFTVKGKFVHAAKTKLTAQGTTVPTEVTDALTAYEGLPDDADFLGVISGIEPANTAEKTSTSLLSAIATAMRNLVLLMVRRDTPLSSNTLQAAAAELIDQMEGASASVDASTAAVSVTPGGSNTGNCVVIASAKSGDGRNVEHALAEDLAVSVVGSSLRIVGEAAVANPLAYNWPGGSGTNLSLTPTQPESSLVTAGTFDTDDTETNRPDGWIVEVGTVGTTIKLTVTEVQTVVISGTPTSGFYTLSYENADGNVQTTAPLAYNATESQVQAALRLLDGLEEIEVETTGTSPNFTHAITFVGVAGNVAILTSSETFDTGSIAHNQTTAGSDNAFRGTAFEIDSNGSELTELRVRLANPTANGVYAFCARVKTDVEPAAGLLKVELIDGAGTVIDDDLSVANEIEIDPKSGGDLSTSAFTAITGFFRLPAILPPLVYLRVRISTAVSSGTSVFFDDLALVAARQLYSGGPFVAAFGAPDPGDVWTIAVTNDRAGEFQEWCYRLGITQRGQLLPSNASGSETIADSLIG